LAKTLALIAQTTASFSQKNDHNIGFGGKGQFLRRKLAKIAENRDNNIDPRCPFYAHIFPAMWNHFTRNCHGELV
jgi:hypothetical protein